jgi:hypothetical protein
MDELTVKEGFQFNPALKSPSCIGRDEDIWKLPHNFF